MCNIAGSLGAYAGDDSVSETRYYYAGSIGENLPIQMELIFDSGDVTGSYMYDKVGTPITLTGTLDKAAGTLSLDEQDDKGLKTGSFKGSIKSEGKSFGNYIEGKWTKSSGLTSLPFRLTKVADFVSVSVSSKDKYEATFMYPSFVTGTNAGREISEKLEREAAAEKKKFIEQADEFFKSQESAGEWQENYNYSIEYYSPELISLSGEVFSYTGGAHGNTFYVSSNYWIKQDKALPLSLHDLFTPKSDYLNVLSDLCIRDLRKQQAGWVLSGELKELKAEDLGAFAISPGGITFAFAPYVVGPYVEGPYFVTIGYGGIKDIVKADGPLGQFIK
ncbi:MAG TPA: DUF3298 and DUF4163 domain-containing protein [Thermodesulfobacteriota bacterium]|nr:DUF3298 and DUF4163 domain-containing protein [Thermodesulfobacteriota bacterium]